MKLVITFAAAALVAPFSLGPLGPPVQDSVQERYDAFIASVANAAALEYRFEGEVSVSYEGELKAQVNQSGSHQQNSGSARLAWPCAGRLLWEATSSSPEDKEPLKFSMEWVGTGESLYLLESERNLAQEVGKDWSLLGDTSQLTGSFTSRKPQAYQFVENITSPDRPTETGFRVLVDATQTETIWIDGVDAVVGFERVHTGPGFRSVTNLTFSGWRVHAEADLADFAVPLADTVQVVEDIEAVPDNRILEEDLLAVGSDAPDVTLIGMDDVEFQLASLEGKTVLLNFWFYH